MLGHYWTSIQNVKIKKFHDIISVFVIHEIFLQADCFIDASDCWHEEVYQTLNEKLIYWNVSVGFILYTGHLFALCQILYGCYFFLSSNFVQILWISLGLPICKQVDILISKNQALQILYLKHCVYNETT